MSFGGMGGFGAGPNQGLATSEEDWRRYLAQIQARQQAQMSPGRYGPESPGSQYIPQVVNPSSTMPGGNPPNAPLVGAANTAVASVATEHSGEAAQNTGGPASTAVNTAHPSTGAGPGQDTTGDNTQVRSGRFYSDYPWTSIPALRNDTTGRVGRLWSDYYNQGGDAYARVLNSMFPDPRTFMQTQGVNAKNFSDPQNQLDWTQRFFDVASGRRKINGGYGLFSGKDVVANILNAKYDKDSGSIGQSLGDKGLLPEEQVKNTVGMMATALQSILSPDQLQSYVAMIGKLGDQFIEDRARHHEKMQGQTFNRWLLSQLGPGGGLY